MKILFIAPTYSGGIGGHAKRVAEKLCENGFDVKLMEVPHIPIKKLKNPSFAILGSLKAIFGRESYDIVHAFNIPSAFAMRYVKAKKRVLSVHGVYSEQVDALHSDTTASIAEATEARVLTWADKLTTDSKMVQKAYKEKLDIDFEFLYAPLDTKKFVDLPDVSKIENQAVYIGRDSYEKGIDILKNIESKIHGNVEYCTNVDWKQAMTILKSSCLLVIPSRMESIPQVIKEAFFLHVPVVATNIGGIPELITDNHTGLLIPYDDSEKLVEVINNLLSNLELSNSLSKEAYNFVINHMTWKKVLSKYIDFYTNLLNS